MEDELLPESCSRCNDADEAFCTSVFLDFCNITLIGGYMELCDFEVSNKKVTLQQDPNESLLLSCRINNTEVDSMYACKLKLSFDNNLHHVSQSYVYDISLKVLLSKNGNDLHVPLCKHRINRDERTISSDTTFFMNIDGIDDAVDSKKYHLCCIIERVNLKLENKKKKSERLHVGEALRKEHFLNDVRFNVNRDQWQLAHRAVLSLYSPVFRKIFSEDNVAENRIELLAIDDIDKQVFDAMLNYLYTGRVGSSLTEFPAKLFKAAERYQIDKLMEMCEEAMMFVINPDNVVEFLDLAKNYKLETTRSTAMTYIAKYEKDMVKKPSYQEFLRRDLSLDTLVYTLKLADKYSELSKIKDVVFKFVKQNCEEVAKNEEYLKLFLSHPKLMQEAFVYMSRRDS